MAKLFKILWTMLTWGDGLHAWSQTYHCRRQGVESETSVCKIYRKSRHSKQLRIITIKDVIED